MSADQDNPDPRASLSNLTFYHAVRDRLTVADLVHYSWLIADQSGFHEPRHHDGPDKPAREASVLERLMLIVSELSEAMEEVRDGTELGATHYSIDKHGNPKPEGFIVEIADAIIRIGDLCGVSNLDIEKAIVEKMKYNMTREKYHGRTI